MPAESVAARLLAALASDPTPRGLSSPPPFRSLLAALADHTPIRRPGHDAHPMENVGCSCSHVSPGVTTAMGDIVDFGTRGVRRPAQRFRPTHPRRSGRQVSGVILLSLTIVALLLAGLALILPSVRGPSPATDPPIPAPFSFKGLGFDSCMAPKASKMKRWLATSPYRAVFVDIGGINMACAQPYLTSSWVREVEAQGWTIFPIYVGPQLSEAQIDKKNAVQLATASASAAVTQLTRLGLPSNLPIFYDMEAYPEQSSPAAMKFFDAWDRTLKAKRYYSGIYSNSLSGISDLNNIKNHVVQPDVAFDALWSGSPTGALSTGELRMWQHRYAIQYYGLSRITYGGVSMYIDKDAVDIRLRGISRKSGQR